MSKAARLEAFYEATLAAGAAPSKAVGINIAMLRSGRQFDAAPTVGDEAVPTMSKAARLEAFYEATLAAGAAPSKAVGINIAYLCSGKQFNAAATTCRTAAAVVATAATSFTGPKTSKFNRLHRYYNSTLAAHAVITPKATVSSDTMPPTMVNLDLLKSGGSSKLEPTTTRARFLATNGPGTPPHLRKSASNARKSKNQKLEEFYQQTLKAVETAASSRKKVGLAAAPTSATSVPVAATATVSKAQRMMMQTKSNASTPTMINLSFLRSSLQFKRQTGANAATRTAAAIKGEAGSRSSGKSRHGRLEDFYAATLSAAAEGKAALKAAETASEANRRTQSNAATPTMLNLEFLRSGLEFVRTGTTTVWAFSRAHGAFVPTKVKVSSANADAAAAAAKQERGEKRRSSARSRYTRLEDFYKATLAAQAPVARSKGLAGPA